MSCTILTLAMLNDKWKVSTSTTKTDYMGLCNYVNDDTIVLMDYPVITISESTKGRWIICVSSSDFNPADLPGSRINMPNWSRDDLLKVWQTEYSTTISPRNFAANYVVFGNSSATRIFILDKYRSIINEEISKVARDLVNYVYKDIYSANPLTTSITKYDVDENEFGLKCSKHVLPASPIIGDFMLLCAVSKGDTWQEAVSEITQWLLTLFEDVMRFIYKLLDKKEAVTITQST